MIAVAFISFLLTFLNGGLSETFAAFQFALLAACTFSYLLIERSIKFSKPLIGLISGWAGSFVAMVVIITAPGNSVRQEFFPEPPGIIKLISISLESYTSFWHTILVTPEKVMGLLGGILLSMWVGSMLNTYGESQIHEKKTPKYCLSYTIVFCLFPARSVWI